MALGLYQPPLSRAVRLLKYHGRTDLAVPLGAALGQSVRQRWPEHRFDSVVPVPLHPGRLRARGYNQAAEVGRGVSAALGVPLQPRWLIRTRGTAQQARLTVHERHTNLKDAFAPGPLAPGARVLLVDDVLTTGATAGAAAGALVQGGAGAVYLAVLAVSPRPVW